MGIKLYINSNVAVEWKPEHVTLRDYGGLHRGQMVMYFGAVDGKHLFGFKDEKKACQLFFRDEWDTTLFVKIQD